jgi:hypothetical protein
VRHKVAAAALLYYSQYLGIDAPFCASCLPQIREGRNWPVLDHLHPLRLLSSVLHQLDGSKSHCIAMRCSCGAVAVVLGYPSLSRRTNKRHHC